MTTMVAANLVTIYRSFGPFMCLRLGVLAVLLFFPEISLFLLRWPPAPLRSAHAV